MFVETGYSFENKKLHGCTKEEFGSNRSTEQLLRGNLKIEPNWRTKLQSSLTPPSPVKEDDRATHSATVRPFPPRGEARAPCLASPLGGFPGEAYPNPLLTFQWHGLSGDAVPLSNLTWESLVPSKW